MLIEPREVNRKPETFALIDQALKLSERLQLLVNGKSFVARNGRDPGSTRVMTTVAGGIYDSMDYMPFGELILGGGGTRYKFTGKERDSESNLDNFGARYDSSSLGRFMSPDWSDDPEAVPFASFSDPQTLNLYTYVRNNPLSGRDTDGHHQECGDQTSSHDAQGNLVVQANCHEVPDFFLCPLCSKDTRARFQAQFDQDYARMANGQLKIYASTIPGPGDLAGDLENLLQELKAGAPELQAESEALQKIIDDLFKPSDTLPGGTAGAVRNELKTGARTGGKLHSIKAGEQASRINKLINTGTLSTKDTNLAKALWQDLKNSVAGK